MVADLLRPAYDRTDGQDGFVSLEVSPGLAYDTAGTIEEARRLWFLVNRPNAMIKVPATLEGLPAIQQLTGEGININITLLFGLPCCREVADAYITGLETLAAEGKNLKQVASAASFFLSRIDVLLDPILEKKIQAGGPHSTANLICEIIGTFALMFGVFLIRGATMTSGGTVVPISMGALGAIAVAFLVWVIGLALGGPTGYAINPACDLGPRIMHAILPIAGKGDSDWGYSWIPAVGPIIGGAIATFIFLALPH
jgi:hypothetical protein